MTRTTTMKLGAAAATLLMGVTTATADYHTNPELKPSSRCGTALQKNPLPDPGNIESLENYTTDCQPLYWDLPATVQLHVPVRAEYDRITGFLHGRIDRPPSLYTDGVDGFDEPGLGLTQLCPDVPDPVTGGIDHQVPWWAPAGQDTDGTNLYTVECRRGVRVHYGPWQVGTDPAIYDRVAEAIVRFENTAQLNDDNVALANRREWNVASEFYNHFGSHHGTCWNPGVGFQGTGQLQGANPCNNPDDTATASSYDQCGTNGNPPPPGSYQSGAETCPGSDPRFHCSVYNGYNQQFRNATQSPGRLFVDLPTGRAVYNLEDQLWACDHHVVSELPIGYQGNTTFRNFRNQTGGLIAQHAEDGWPAPGTTPIGGTVGEMIIQLFSAPVADGSYKPISVGFDVVANVATTFFPPYTIGNTGSVWYAPYDLAIGILAIHSHKRTVKGTIDILPANPIRTGGLSPEEAGGRTKPQECGVSQNGLPPEHIYADWHWDDPPVCRYYKEPDGPLILHKGDALATHCIHNNGVIQTEQAPEPFRTMIRDGVVGDEVLFGEQKDDLGIKQLIYRVRYGCEQFPGVPPGSIGSPAQVCPPNPATDPPGCALGQEPDCHPVDGPYPNPAICTRGTGNCVPANIVFANVAEDEMCIGVVMYGPLDEILNADGSLNQQAIQDFESDPNNINKYGTPGRLPKSPSDIGYCSGCGPGL